VGFGCVTANPHGNQDKTRSSAFSHAATWKLGELCLGQYRISFRSDACKIAAENSARPDNHTLHIELWSQKTPTVHRPTKPAIWGYNHYVVFSFVANLGGCLLLHAGHEFMFLKSVFYSTHSAPQL
jgi:hypothetical protein